MSRTISSKRFVLAGFVGVICGLLFEFVGPGLLFKPHEVELCKQFIFENSSSKEYFGSIQSIGLIRNKGSRGTSWSSQHGKSARGRYHFKVDGALRKAFVRVRWNESDGVMKITRLSIREGFIATRIIWPKSESTSPKYFLSAHTGDGIVSLVLLVLFLLLYHGFDTGSRWLSFVHKFFNWGEKLRVVMKWVFLVSVFVAALKSILCFAGISTLF